MKLYITCSSCYKDIKIKQKATTKFELERKYSEEIEVMCTHCGTSNTRHVNRVFAKIEWFYLIAGFAISVLLSIILTFMIGGIALLFLTAPGVLIFGQQKSVNAFNRSMVVRKSKS